jgi:uncharacterized membrane protein YphA (DoxX/SURF4 family)
MDAIAQFTASATIQELQMDRKKRIASHIIAGLLTLAFLGSGATKLLGMEPMPEQFQGWGYPIWFMYLTGLIEVGCAALVAIPKTRLVGGLGLFFTMIGAIGTHLIHAEFGALAAPSVLLILSGSVLWLQQRGR